MLAQGKGRKAVVVELVVVPLPKFQQLKDRRLKPFRLIKEAPPIDPEPGLCPLAIQRD
jgi:hypothetical protein